jgi:hypothetical protein
MPTEIITQPNIWHVEWGSITDSQSNAPIGWQYNNEIWEYVGPTAAESQMIFQTSTATCIPPPNTYSSLNNNQG